jgi:hypothetical protein
MTALDLICDKMCNKEGSLTLVLLNDNLSSMYYSASKNCYMVMNGVGGYTISLENVEKLRVYSDHVSFEVGGNGYDLAFINILPIPYEHE